MKCPVCFRHCELAEGQVGFCRARVNRGGRIVAKNYGAVTSLALDPIEKKPLLLFHPGSKILSVGSYGCNLRCPFCQNYEISQFDLSQSADILTPEALVEYAQELVPQGNIGLAYTYNEPLVGYEFVRDCARLIHERGLLNVLVSNGTASLDVLGQVLPYIDAMNVDLKGFSEEFYRFVGGDLGMVKDFIALACRESHLEITTLIIPGRNDSKAMMEEEARWIASLDPEIALHITRYFPRYKEKEPPTEVGALSELAAVARRYLKHVYLGNV
ncbi:MAG: AmmeMemoRadiSam system radical SAM enzyme [Bacilli bacterium]|nr:AmmeMemoRadiSam system radical SAM enzyme [Bacilli bacterium]